MLVTVVDFPSLPNDSYDPTLIDFLSRISAISTILLKIPLNGIVFDEKCINFLQSIFLLGVTNMEGFHIDDDEIVTKLLDSGLQTAYFQLIPNNNTIRITTTTTTTTNEDKEKILLKKVAKSLPRSRIGLSIQPSIPLSSQLMKDIIQEYSDSVFHFYFKCDLNATNHEHQVILKTAQELINSSGFAIQICFELPLGTSESVAASFATFMDGIQVAAHMTLTRSANPQHPWPIVYANPYALTSDTQAVLPIASITDNTNNEKPMIPLNQSITITTPTLPPSPHSTSVTATGTLLGTLDIISLYVTCLRSDRSDKLYTTVVCDEHGICLGLVYSNQESIRVAVTERRGVYWSRSRSSLWRKGDSSGMFQELITIKVDCDFDALRFTVYQRGDPPSFCHLMTRTCWGHVNGIKKLETILMDRKKAAPEGSYTKRLFDDPELLRKKLLEEVQELVEAEEPDHVAAEAADVMYFTMTRCVAAGVGLREIEQHLDRRTFKVTRRPGNAKEWRTKNAQEKIGENYLSKASLIYSLKIRMIFYENSLIYSLEL